MGREGFVRGLLLAALVTLSGCADGTHITGFGSSGAPAIVPTGDVPASKSMATKYGITHWRMFSGVNHTVVTGYRADGTAARGVDLAWFKQAADGTPGHLRLTMLDGSGTIVRRYVGGKATGQLSADQMALVVTQQVDFYEHFLSLVPAKQAKMRKHLSPVGGGGTLHLQDDGAGGGASSAPNTGPECSAALAGGNTSGAGCALSLTGTVVSSETILGGLAEGMHAVYECGEWAVESNEVQSTCETENTTHCSVAADGGWENCDYSSETTGDTGSSTSPSGGGLDQQTLCANYPDSSACSGLVKTNGFCSTSDQCAAGDECNQGFCSTAGYTGVPGDDCTNPDAVKYSGDKCSTSDAPTDQELQSSSNSNCLSCAPGTSDVTANPQNGDVNSGSSSDSSGSSSGGAGAGSSGSSSSGGGSGDDPGGSLGGGTPSCGGQGGDCSGGGACCSPLVCDPGTSTCVTTDQMMGGSSCTAYYGDACSSDSDCCLGSCDPSSSTCSSGGSSSGGSSGGSSSSGSSSGGGSCASDGASCAADTDCCSGTCDTSSGTCGSTSGSSSGGSSSSGSSSGGSCTADGATCSSDAECCSGTCDPSTSTCGTASGSSSGSSGSSSGGGSCAADGSACASDTDCCSGTCDPSSFTCGTGSGSSSGGSSSGSSGGGSCTADGQSCGSASDCCSQVCGTCDGLCGGNSAGASGAPCSSDADCCNSCDTANGVCL